MVINRAPLECISKKSKQLLRSIDAIKSNRCWAGRSTPTPISMLSVMDFNLKGTISEVRVHTDAPFGHMGCWSIDLKPLVIEVELGRFIDISIIYRFLENFGNWYHFYQIDIVEPIIWYIELATDTHEATRSRACRALDLHHIAVGHEGRINWLWSSLAPSLLLRAAKLLIDTVMIAVWGPGQRPAPGLISVALHVVCCS